jgi:hypothetical protein
MQAGSGATNTARSIDRAAAAGVEENNAAGSIARKAKYAGAFIGPGNPEVQAGRCTFFEKK